MKSKANLKHYITVSFYDANGVLLDEDHISLNESFQESNYGPNNLQSTALIFLVLAIILDWNAAFLVLGVVFLILSLRDSNKKEECSTTESDDIKRLE